MQSMGTENKNKSVFRVIPFVYYIKNNKTKGIVGLKPEDDIFKEVMFWHKEQ